MNGYRVDMNHGSDDRVRPATPVECGHEGPDEVYDANGWKRWCANCGAPLYHVERERSGLFWPVLLFIVAWIVLVVISLSGATDSEPAGPRVTPTAYPNPPVVHSTP